MTDMSNSPIGKSILRKEDQKFLTGAGQYTDDITLQGQTYAVFLRSPHAHANIKSIDLSAARKAPGVVAIFTGTDLAEAKVGGLPCGWLIHNKDGKPMNEPAHPVLAQGKVRHVGDQVALVVAESVSQAKDAAEMIQVDYEVLPAVINIMTADKAGASGIHEGAPNNLCYDWGHGDKASVDAAIAGAAHVTKLSFRNNRLVPNAMEPRACNAVYTKHDESYLLYVANQNPHVERLLMTAFVLGLPESKVRVIAPDVGGGFGSKIFLYAEDTALVWASKTGWPADQVDRRAQRILPDRRPRPGPSNYRRTGDGCERQIPGSACQYGCQYGRLSVDFCLGSTDNPVRNPARWAIRYSGNLLRGQGGLHEYRTGGRLSRCRQTGSYLRCRANGRTGRSGDETRPCRNTPT